MKLYCPITIDLYKVYPLQVMEAQQGNVGRGAIVTLTAGSAVIDPTDETVEVYAKKPDGTVSWLECSVEDAKVKINFTNQMLMSPGILQVELRMKDDEDDITTPIFMVKVNKSNVQSAGRSENELPLLDQIKKNAEDAKTAAEAAETAVGKLSKDIVTKASAIKETASGEVIVVNDSDEQKPLGLAIDGKSYQKQYSGKNRLKNEGVSGTQNGVEFDINKDGTAICNGTSTGDITFVLQKNIPLEMGSYILNGTPINGSSSTYRTMVSLVKNGTTTYVADYGEGKSMVIDETVTKIDCSIRISPGVTLNNLVFKPMISLEGGEYEPYCGGMPSPNPSYPQEIRNIGVYDEASGKYAVEVKGTGKNLLDINNPYLKETLFSKEGVPNTNKNFDSFRFRIKKSDTLVVKATRTESSVNLRGLFFDLNMKFLTYIFSELEPGETKREYTATEDGYLIICNRKENTNVVVHYSHITDDTYEPYKETTATVYLDEPLRKGDKAYWNGGKLLVERNAFYGRIISDLDWKYSTGTNSFWAEDYRFEKGKVGNVAPNALCNMFIMMPQQNNITDLSFSYVNDAINGYAFRHSALNGDINTWKQFLDENEVYVCGEANEPTTEEIDIDLDLSMFYPTTILSNDCNANMEVEYIADTKAYIDKKFAELATAMV